MEPNEDAQRDEARDLRNHLVILFSGIIIVIIASAVVFQIRIADLLDKVQARCEDSKEARKWVTDELDLVNFVILTRRSDDPELVAKVEALELRKAKEFEPIECP